MQLKTHLSILIGKLRSGDFSWTDIKHYIVGHWRSHLYNYYPYLLFTHIKEQIDFRVSVMDKECYNNGQCKICQCETIALQCCSKSCEGDCYPEMFSREDWNRIKECIVTIKYISEFNDMFMIKHGYMWNNYQFTKLKEYVHSNLN